MKTVMKTRYIKPSIAVIVMEDLCETNGLNAATVETNDHTHVDHFEVVEEDKSRDQYDWGSGSFGGD